MDELEREIGSLWAKEGKGGTFYTGVINGERVVMFKQKQSNDRQPVFKILKEKERDI